MTAPIPATLKAVLDSFRSMASNPALYKLHIDALSEAVNDMASRAEAEEHRCECCGYETCRCGGRPSSRNPHADWDDVGKYGE